MAKAHESFEVSFLEATRRFLPVMPPECTIGGTKNAVTDEKVDQDVARIHDDVG
jgi:hypothetical protein